MFSAHILSTTPLEHLKINKDNIKTLGKLSYDSSFYDTDEALNRSFSKNVALIQKYIGLAPRSSVTIEIDNHTFYVSKDTVQGNGINLTDDEIQSIMEYIVENPL